MITTTTYTCSICGDRFALDTGEDPAELDDAIVCEDCACDHGHFPCWRCGDCGDIAVQHALLVVADAPAVGLLLPGVYQVEATPYYWHTVLDAGVVAHRVRWLGYCEAAAVPDPYPCGHLCASCQQEVRAALAQQEACQWWTAAQGWRS